MKISPKVIWLGVVLGFVFRLHAGQTGIGQAAPPIRTDYFQAGRPQNSTTKVYIVNFWATWCGPCREELPFFRQLYGEYRQQGLEIIAVNVDKDVTRARNFARSLGILFPVIYDSEQKIVARYSPVGMPTSFVIDRRGIVRHVHKGFTGRDKEKFHHEIKTLLKQ